MLKLNKNRNFKKADKGATYCRGKKKVKIQDDPVQIKDLNTAIKLLYEREVNNPALNVFLQVTWHQS